MAELAESVRWPPFPARQAAMAAPAATEGSSAMAGLVALAEAVRWAPTGSTRLLWAAMAPRARPADRVVLAEPADRVVQSAAMVVTAGSAESAAAGGTVEAGRAARMALSVVAPAKTGGAAATEELEESAVTAG